MSSNDSGKYLALFARRLREARLRSGMTQMQLGVLAGVDEFSASARLNQYERGKHAPDVLTARSLARVLDVPLCYFYAYEEQQARLLLTFNALSVRKRHMVLKFAEQMLNAGK